MEFQTQDTNRPALVCERFQIDPNGYVPMDIIRTIGQLPSQPNAPTQKGRQLAPKVG